MALSDYLPLLGPILKPVLVALETETIQPELKKLIAGVSSPDMKEFLTVLDEAIDAFAMLEINKL
jgi:hypothetical protein